MEDITEMWTKEKDHATLEDQQDSLTSFDLQRKPNFGYSRFTSKMGKILNRSFKERPNV